MPSFTVFRGSPDGNPKPSTTTKPDELTGDLVLVRIRVSGLCGTDLRFRKADMALGHEGVGVVEDVGPGVQSLKKGDRVGWGYQFNCCGNCISCFSGAENFCKKREIYAQSHRDQGSFGSHAVWREAFLHPIPDSISDEDAAPLQCAGATIFTALEDVQPNETVGIMGMGGLGHLAIQFAAKMGCRVVVLSGSDRKKQDSLRYGAHKFLTSTVSGDGRAGFSEALDNEWLISRLLVTTSVLPAWSAILPLMAHSSRIYPLTGTREELKISAFPLLQGGISVHGVLTSSRSVHRKMLQFVALHGIKPVIERYPMTEEGLKEAMDRLDRGKVHYRAVLVAPRDSL